MTPMDREPMTLAEIAEAAALRHYCTAADDDAKVSAFDADPYKRSRAMLMAAIGSAYPDVEAQEVYEVWVDCGESIRYCANRVAELAEGGVMTLIELIKHLERIASADRRNTLIVRTVEQDGTEWDVDEVRWERDEQIVYLDGRKA